METAILKFKFLDRLFISMLDKFTEEYNISIENEEMKDWYFVYNNLLTDNSHGHSEYKYNDKLFFENIFLVKKATVYLMEVRVLRHDEHEFFSITIDLYGDIRLIAEEQEKKFTLHQIESFIEMLSPIYRETLAKLKKYQ